MKKTLLALLLFCLFSVTIPAFGAAADTAIPEDDKAALENALVYHGMQARIQGVPGIRASFCADMTVIHALEQKGYTVSFGALMGATYDDNGIQKNGKSADLTITPETYFGFSVDNARAAGVLIYKTRENGKDSPYASYKFNYIDDTRAVFTYSTIFGESTQTADYYDIPLVYRAFALLEKTVDGVTETAVVYCDTVADVLPEAVSAAVLYRYFMETYSGSDAEAIRASATVQSVYAGVGTETVLSGVKLSDGKSVALSETQSATLTVTPAVSGWYSIAMRYNCNNEKVEYIYAGNRVDGQNVLKTVGRIDNTTASTENAADDTYAVADGTAYKNVVYTYLIAGKTNTVTFTAKNGAMGVTDVRVSCVTAFNEEDAGTVLLRSGDITEKNLPQVVGSGLYEGFVMVRSGDYYARYTVTPAVSGAYRLYAMAHIDATSNPTVTVTENQSDLKTFSLGSDAGTYSLGNTCSTSHAPIPFDGTVTLKKGVTYTVTVKSTNNYINYSQLLLVNTAEETDDHVHTVVLSRDCTNDPTAENGVTLLGDHVTYAGTNGGKFIYKVTTTAAGIYGFRLKAVRSADNVNYRLAFNASSNKDGSTLYYGRLPGETDGTSTYGGADLNVFAVPYATVNGAFSGDPIGYQYLATGENTVTLNLAGSKGYGICAVEYTLLTADDENTLRVKAKDIKSNTAKVGTTGSVTTNDNAVFLNSKATAQITGFVTISAPGIYRIYGLMAMKGKMTFTLTNENGYTVTCPYTGGERSLGGQSTSVLENDYGEFFLVAGTYSMTLQAVDQWVNLADMRFAFTEAATLVGGGETTDTADVTVPEDGYYRLVTKADTAAPLSLLLDGTAVASSAGSTADGVTLRTIAALYLRKGQSYRFSIRNDGTKDAVVGAVNAVYDRERSLKTGYFLDFAGSDGTENESAVSFTVNTDYSGDYRLTLYLNAGETVAVPITVASPDNAQMYATTVTVAANADGIATVYIPDAVPLMAGVGYTVTVGCPETRVNRLSFDLVMTATGNTVRFSEATLTPGSTVTDSYVYTDTAYKGFSRTTLNLADNAYGLTGQTTAFRSQDKNSGNKVAYDPLGITLHVENTGYYNLRFLYTTTSQTAARVSAYMDGALTPGYWQDGPTVSGSNLTGTWVPYVYTKGETGIVLCESRQLSGTSASTLSSTVLSESVYLTAGDHNLYIANAGTWSVNFVGISLTPCSASDRYAEFDATLYRADYDAENKTLHALLDVSGRNSYGFPSYTVILEAYDKNDRLLGTVSCESDGFTCRADLTLTGITGYAYGKIRFTDAAGATLRQEYKVMPDDYKVVFLSDTHLYDWDDLYFTSSAERIAWAVDSILFEHRTYGKIDLVVIPGDVVNNYLYEYGAGTFEGWKAYTDKNGVLHESKYKGTKYPAGSSGTENDPLGVLRILSFLELMEPLEAEGIPVFFVHGNHDCYRDTIFEMGFGLNKKDGFIAGVKQYERDADGNLLVPDFKIENGEITLYTRTVTPNDADYAAYSKGYGKNYAFKMSDNVAYTVYDNFHVEGVTVDGVYYDNGFIANASGRSWGETTIPAETVSALNAATAGYRDVYVVIHSMSSASMQPSLAAAIRDNDNIVAVFDGHTHLETVKPNAVDSGKYALTCGYLGVPMFEQQSNFRNTPFSYRVLESHGDSLESYIVLMEKDYPAYTYTKSSGVTTDAFYQPYFRRKTTVIR